MKKQDFFTCKKYLIFAELIMRHDFISSQFDSYAAVHSYHISSNKHP